MFTVFNTNLTEKYSVKRLLTSADDFNGITDNGIYWYMTESIPANAPYDNAAIIEVIGSKSNSTQKLQRATRYGVTGQSAFRALDLGGWKDWAYILTDANIQIIRAAGKTIAGSNIVTATVPGLKIGKACVVTCNTTTTNHILCAAAIAENTLEVRFANNFDGVATAWISVAFIP